MHRAVSLIGCAVPGAQRPNIWKLARPLVAGFFILVVARPNRRLPGSLQRDCRQLTYQSDDTIEDPAATARVVAAAGTTARQRPSNVEVPPPQWLLSVRLQRPGRCRLSLARHLCGSPGCVTRTGRRGLCRAAAQPNPECIGEPYRAESAPADCGATRACRPRLQSKAQDSRAGIGRYLDPAEMRTSGPQSC
jgi:hypothetical protein